MSKRVTIRANYDKVVRLVVLWIQVFMVNGQYLRMFRVATYRALIHWKPPTNCCASNSSSIFREWSSHKAAIPRAEESFVCLILSPRKLFSTLLAKSSFRCLESYSICLFLALTGAIPLRFSTLSLSRECYSTKPALSRVLHMDQVVRGVTSPRAKVSFIGSVVGHIEHLATVFAGFIGSIANFVFASLWASHDNSVTGIQRDVKWEINHA